MSDPVYDTQVIFKVDLNHVYKLKLHETLVVSETPFATSVMRVPGGFIYATTDGIRGVSTVFVPFNNEFMIDAVRGNK